jgi:multidrug efflux pump subunit AcrA (membrane-fusion protein)
MNKRFFIIIAILAVGVSLMIAVIKTAPKPVKKPVVVMAPLVETMEIALSTQTPKWQGGASVNGNKSVKLVAQVMGQIVSVNPQAVPGSFVTKGVVLARVDDASYQLVYEQRKAQVIQAQSSLDMELAQVENSKKDYERSGMKLKPAGKALALRQPQLASAKAALAIARSELDKAALDLQRTQITMPFNGHVLAQNLTAGAFVNNASAVFEVLDADEYWLEVKVPQSFLQVLDLDQPSELAVAGVNSVRLANILTVLPQVDATDRQARILISIKDPLLITSEALVRSEANAGLPVIRYNDYVNVTLSGKRFNGASLIKTDSLNETGGIWVVDASFQLQNRAVSVLYAGREYSWVNISSYKGDEILLSRIDSPKAGMKLRVSIDGDSEKKELNQDDAKNNLTLSNNLKEIADAREINVAEAEVIR